MMRIGEEKSPSVVPTRAEDDRQKKQIIAQLAEAVECGCDPSIIGQNIEILTQFMAKRFADEEKLMEYYRYPDIVDHSFNHHLAFSYIGQIINALEVDDGNGALGKITQIKEFLERHAHRDDAGFRRYLRDEFDGCVADGPAFSKKVARSNRTA